jgi:hypothetical protein
MLAMSQENDFQDASQKFRWKVAHESKEPRGASLGPQQSNRWKILAL